MKGKGSNRLGRSVGVAAQEDLIIFDFASPEELQRWQPINDAVMGGISSGRIIQRSQSTALFTGTVSLEFWGGFSSVRASLEMMDLTPFEGICVRASGDGKTYKLNLMDDPAFDGPQFQSRFQPANGNWVEIPLPFGEMTPTFRGRILKDHRNVKRSHVSSIGLMISDKQAGPFALEIDWIKAYHALRPRGKGGV
jgi:NADH dehydrogenase [ubiquinone] 1 alpha subcomplex assembly factor 1